MENKEICAKCGGKCCFKSPGVTFPEDWGLPSIEGEAKLKEALLSGKWCVDWWEGDDESLYYVRPAYKGLKSPVFHGGWGGPCGFLTKRGCELTHDQRPAECRELIPVEDGPCVGNPEFNKRAASIAWMPYKEFFAKLKEELWPK